MKLIYLAGPYTHTDKTIRHDRAEHASMVAGELAMLGYAVYSPITHGHGIEPHVTPPFRTDHNFWMRQCFRVLEMVDELWILPLLGWRDSRGLSLELQFCKDNSIPIRLIQNMPFGFERHIEWVKEKEIVMNGWTPVHEQFTQQGEPT